MLLGEEFPLYHQNVPITYLSTNDFLNLLDELRAFPDIEGYFDARRCLPEESLRCVGSERHLFEYYLIREQSFVGCQGVEYVNESVAENKHELTAAIERKCEADNYARIVEHVSDALADRHAEYNEGLEEKLLSRFDDPTNRQNYLVMQEELCDLQLSDRRLVGYQFEQVIRKVQEDDHSESMAYAAIWADAKPDFLYVLVSARGISRPVLLERCTVLLSGALAFYGKPSGIVVADRDGASYEIQLIANQEQSAQSKEIGQQFFQNLEMSAYPSTFSPS
ncbi:hypothetical protein MYX78_04845 [Acidobacteria bacterium AH-259-G07]|nr:hypothetical protein [Acidobacteria bacterium AH-259-G07]